MKDITAIVYTSNTGFTMQYAQMLGQAAAIPVYDLEDGISRPAPGARVLYLGWLAAGKIRGFAKARRHWDIRAICAVGMTQEGEIKPAAVATANRVEKIPLFYLRGGYAPQKLAGISKVLMGMMAKAVARKPPKDEAGRQMQRDFATGGSWVAEKNLTPVLAWLREG